MATVTMLKIGYVFLSIPFIVFSRIVEKINLWGIRRDLDDCLRTVDYNLLQPIPLEFIKVLFVAEDRRNPVHFGVDPIGMIRALISIVAGKGIQGASTIEQQFVRVISGSYERTIRRKIREQALAIAVARRRSKLQIAVAYLSVAYYGHDLVGVRGLRNLCGPSLDKSPSQTIHKAIAYLKYPRPSSPSEIWKQKVRRRVEHIVRRVSIDKKMSTSTVDQFVPGKLLNRGWIGYWDTRDREHRSWTYPKSVHVQPESVFTFAVTRNRYI